MKKHIFALALLAGCQTAPQTAAIEPGAAYTLSESEQAAVKRGVIAMLKDPESARFEGLRASKDSEGVVMVCGYVNARNSFGGYAGNQAFTGVLYNGQFGVGGLANDSAVTNVIRQKCAEGGIVI